MSRRTLFFCCLHFWYIFSAGFVTVSPNKQISNFKPIKIDNEKNYRIGASLQKEWRSSLTSIQQCAMGSVKPSINHYNGQVIAANVLNGTKVSRWKVAIATAIAALAGVAAKRFGSAHNILFGEISRSWYQLVNSLQGGKLDSILMLVATSTVIPLSKLLSLSPIIGFLLAGAVLGPNGFNLLTDVHAVDMLGELGIVFFLFEMGLELSLDRLKAMRRDVFGLGTCQFLLTSMAAALVCRLCGLSVPAAVAVGGSVALSSSAFVLQLLKDEGAMATRHAQASFGILLLQDLAVVPLLIVVELLGRGGGGLWRALGVAGLKAAVTLTALLLGGKPLLDPVFKAIAKSKSHEAFLSIILGTVLLMSFVTKGIGLSDTLGAFLAGLLLSETSYRHQIEADIAPLRGLLLGFFFITVGFNIDVRLVVRDFPLIVAVLGGLIAGKVAIITLLGLLFGISLPAAQLTGLLNSQGGEFAFVSLGVAERLRLLPSRLTKVLMTCVALSMAATPLLANLGKRIATKLESPLDQYLVKNVTNEAPQDDFVIVCGYGRAGQLVSRCLDEKLIKYIALDNAPQKAIDAHRKGLPVYYGDIHRVGLLDHFHAQHARACVITFDDPAAVNKAVIRIRRDFPKIPIIVRAKNQVHADRLQAMFDGVHCHNMLPDDSERLLPFGGAVLELCGVTNNDEIECILDSVRDKYKSSKESPTPTTGST